MSIANRSALMEIAVALLQGADASGRRATAQGAEPGLKLVAPSAAIGSLGEPVRRDRRAPGQSSFHLVSDDGERARMMRAERAAAQRAITLGWRAVALGGPADAPHIAAAADFEIALEERPAALVALGRFRETGDGAAAQSGEGAYIARLSEAAQAADAPLWALAARRDARLGFSALALAPRRPAALRVTGDEATTGAPIAFRLLLLG